VFAPSPIAPAFPRRRLSSSIAKAATITVQFAALAGFAVFGTVFLGFAIASPIGLPIAERSAGVLSSSDIATAQHLGSAWWLFAVGALLSFGGALAMIGTLLQHLVPASDA
jgi:hypothetical protein